MKPDRHSWPVRYFDALLLFGLTGLLLAYFDLRYLLLDTTVTGGDTASWQGIAHHLAETLLPEGRLTGWDMGNFCGYPNFNFYFIPPFLVPVAVSKLLNLPLTVCLKWSIMSGIFLLPACVYCGLRNMGHRFPGPVMGASASLLFLFNESYTMFGGNTLSTFAGEFCYMTAFALFTLFIGTYYRGCRTGTRSVFNGILLGLIGLCHLFVFIPAMIWVAYSFFDRAKIRYIAQVAAVGFICMAFWILPILAYRNPYTSPIYMIWQEYVSWRFALAGWLIIALGTGPGLALTVLKNQNEKTRKIRRLGFAGLVASGVLAAVYLGCQFLLLGKNIWHSGLHIPTALLSPGFAANAEPWTLPISIGVGVVVFLVLGFLAQKNQPVFEKFCRKTAWLCMAALMILLVWTLFGFIQKQVPALQFKLPVSDHRAIFLSAIAAGAVLCWQVLRFRQFDSAFLQAQENFQPSRFLYWPALIAGCATVYFGAHFLKVPDIRFLPPMVFALIMILAVETPAPFLAKRRLALRAWTASLTWFAVFLVVMLIPRQADDWYAYNNGGYEARTGYKDFDQANQYLRQSDSSAAKDPLNAPRVAYEKCDLYGPYGGDRVFESLPLFSGRQTLEGIHYASAFSARSIAFLQTEFSKNIKTPGAGILSKINVSALPTHFDLYNISQVIVATDTLKQALGTSAAFSKEAVFGNLWVFRYTGCKGQYVETPRIRPVLYAGENWPDAFYDWLKQADPDAPLMVPDAWVKDPQDRAAFSGMIAGFDELERIKPEPVQTDEDSIQFDLDHFKIRFHTNRINEPHLIKVSYFPNWRVQGAKAVYPVSPHMMLVIPREPEVVLTYGRSGWELAGGAITLLGGLLIIFRGIFRRLNRHGRGSFRKKFPAAFWNFMQKTASAWRTWLLIAALAASVLIIVSGAVLRNRPVRTYIEGHRSYRVGVALAKQEKHLKADRCLTDAVRVMAPLIRDRKNNDHRDVINCILISGQCLEHMKQYEQAEALYRIIASEYFYSRYAAEAHVKLARLAGKDMEALWKNEIKGPPARIEGSETAFRFEHPIRRLEKCVTAYRKAIETEPFSVWVKYARQDLENLNRVLENIQNALGSDSGSDALRAIETIESHRIMIKELTGSSK